MRKWTLRIVILTLTSFLLSYASSVMGNLNSEKSFPNSLFTQYTKTIGNARSIEIEKRIDAGEISEIEIQTSQTDVEIKTLNTSQIRLDLKGHYANHPESIFELQTDGPKLIVKINENEMSGNPFFHLDTEGEGKISLSVPPSISKLKIKTVAGDIDVQTMKLKELILDTVSGDTLLSQTAIDQIQFKSVSGGLAGTGYYLQTNIKSVSGGAKLTFINSNPLVDFKATSGDLELVFPKVPDVQIQFGTISGNFNIDPQFAPASQGKKIEINLGSGIGRVSVNTISGDFKIRKL